MGHSSNLEERGNHRSNNTESQSIAFQVMTLVQTITVFIVPVAECTALIAFCLLRLTLYGAAFGSRPSLLRHAFSES
jgi:hypothetical protein